MNEIQIKYLLSEELQDIYRKVYTNADGEEDERVKIALMSILCAMHQDAADTMPISSRNSNVVQFTRPISE